MYPDPEQFKRIEMRPEEITPSKRRVGPWRVVGINEYEEEILIEGSFGNSQVANAFLARYIDMHVAETYFASYGDS